MAKKDTQHSFLSEEDLNAITRKKPVGETSHLKADGKLKQKSTLRKLFGGSEPAKETKETKSEIKIQFRVGSKVVTHPNMPPYRSMETFSVNVSSAFKLSGSHGDYDLLNGTLVSKVLCIQLLHEEANDTVRGVSGRKDIKIPTKNWSDIQRFISLLASKCSAWGGVSRKKLEEISNNLGLLGSEYSGETWQFTVHEVSSGQTVQLSGGQVVNDDRRKYKDYFGLK